MSTAPTGLEDFKQLLVVQSIDTEIDQLTHRRATLPELGVIEAIKARAVTLRQAIAEASSARNDLAGRQVSLEAEIETISARLAQIGERLYGSAPVAPSDALKMSEEEGHLKDRKRSFEDDELEIMEALEPAQSALERLEADAQSLGAELQTAQQQLADAQGVLDVSIAERTTARADAASSVPSALLGEYEALRTSLGGVAAAPLVGTSCGGCHLTMAGAELDAIKKAAPETVVHCEECGRILVR